MHDEPGSKAAAERHEPTCRLNRAIAWSGFLAGALAGAAMGMWAFDGPLSPPAGLAHYDAPARRLLRLGHIAFFGIGYLNLLLAAELPRLALGAPLKRAAAHAMNLANIVMPTGLIGAAFWAPAKYLLAVPTLAVAAALAIAALGAVRRLDPVLPVSTEKECDANPVEESGRTHDRAFA